MNGELEEENKASLAGPAIFVAVLVALLAFFWWFL